MMALGSELLHNTSQMAAKTYLAHASAVPVNQFLYDGPRHNKPYVYANKSYSGLEQHPSVIRRNARERNRVKQVNNGFISLRQHIPQAIVSDLSRCKRSGGSKKLSKVDTLRMAVEYIRRLQSLLDEDSRTSDGNSVVCGTTPGIYQQPINNNNPNLCFEEKQQFEHFYTTSSACQDVSLISPTSSTYSDGYYSSAEEYAKTQLKLEGSFEEYSSNSTEDEELLDYISLWQEDM